MLRRSGFAFVYGFRTLPNSEFYQTSKWRVRDANDDAGLACRIAVGELSFSSGLSKSRDVRRAKMENDTRKDS